MRAGIFTEGSSTTSESTQKYADYFDGSFLSVNTVANEISHYCETDVHILSEEHGYVKGDDPVGSHTSINTKEATGRFESLLLSSLRDYDVVLLLFTTDVFEEVITPNWDRIVENAKEDSIWCIGTSRRALDSVELGLLEDTHHVLLYQRRGVARLGTEVREELIERIRQRNDD